MVNYKAMSVGGWLAGLRQSGFAGWLLMLFVAPGDARKTPSVTRLKSQVASLSLRFQALGLPT